MKKIFRKPVVLLLSLTFLLLVLYIQPAIGQKMRAGTPSRISNFEDTSINPHDFTDEYYFANGVVPKGIIGRRTGTDFLSVFSLTSNPNHSLVRVIATLPAYDREGNMLFWFPLGEFDEDNFAVTDDATGKDAMEAALANPIYVFPQKMDTGSFAFTNSRQAALIEEAGAWFGEPIANPLGLHVVVTVNYTPKAFTKEYLPTIGEMAKKNGLSLDGTPIIRNSWEISSLASNELITLKVAGFQDQPYSRRFAIGPVILDPRKGVIAFDAFLLMAGWDGNPIPAEAEFVRQFRCLQKSGDWCFE